MKDEMYKAKDGSLFSIPCSLFPVFGFTLIELVIVVSIIALISGISLFALNNARTSGRDARRKADLEEVASGLELYKADQNYYPPDTAVSFGSTNKLTGGGNTYIQAMPDDPNTSNHYSYVALPVTAPPCDNTATNGYCTGFVLWASLEAKPTPTPASYCTNNPDDCDSATSTCNYCVVNP